MIDLRHISKVYPGPQPVHAIKDIDLHIPESEICGIIGLSGAGKSTLIRCINMLETPTEGEVWVDGKNLTAMSEQELRNERKHIGMIFQHFNLLSHRTVYENIAFPLELAGLSKAEQKERIEPILELVGLTQRRDNYPAQLSGGQKQRVGIARALVSRPKVLLCDEATSALDPQTTKAILDLLKDINRRLHLTIVLITHEMQVIKEICNHVAVIENGHIIEQGSVADLFTAPKTATTREFVGSILSNDIPENLNYLHISQTPIPDADLLVRLSFIGDVTDEPLLATLIRRFDLEVSILYATIDYIQDTSFGRLIVTLGGSEDQMQAALAWLRACPIESEVIGYVPANR